MPYLKFQVTLIAFVLLVTSLFAQDSISRRVASLGVDRFQTRDFVQDIAFSPDGKFIAASESGSPSRSRTVRIFFVKNGAEAQVLTDPDDKRGWVTSLTFSPDGTMLLCGAHDGRITLWDLDQGTVAWQRQRHHERIEDVAFSHDGKWWATCTEDGRIDLRRTVDDGRSGRIFRINQEMLEAIGAGDVGVPANSPVVSFTNDGETLISTTGREGGGFFLFDLTDETKDSTPRYIPSPHDDVVITSVHPLNEGNRILTAGYKVVLEQIRQLPARKSHISYTQLQLWDLETGQHLRDLHSKDQHGHGHAAVSSDAAQVVTADSRNLTCLDIESGRTVWSQRLPTISSGPLVWSPHGDVIALQGKTGLKLFHAAIGVQVFPDADRGSHINYASWSADGKQIVTGTADGYIRIWDALSGEMRWQSEFIPEISKKNGRATPNFVTFTPDNRKIIAAGRRVIPGERRTGIVVCFDLNESKEAFRHDFQDDVYSGTINLDGTKLVLATSDDQLAMLGMNQADAQLHGIDVQTGKVLFPNVPEQDRDGRWDARRIAFTEDSENFIVTTSVGEIIRFDSKSGEELSRFNTARGGPIQQVANNHARAALIFQRRAAFGGCDIFDHGSQLLLASEGALRRWDIDAQLLLNESPLAHSMHTRICVSSDGKIAAIAEPHFVPGEDVIRICKTNTGKQLIKIPLPDNRATTMAFSPDGTKLFTGMVRGSAKIWDVRVE